MYNQPARKFPIQDFVANAVFPVTTENKFSCCVDGRYTQVQSGAIAMAGADAGLLAVALGAGNILRKERSWTATDEHIIAATCSLLGGEQNFSYHGDEQDGLAGCGHMKRCITRSPEFGLTHEQGGKLRALLQTLTQKGIQPITLQGQHEEQAVIIITLPDYVSGNSDSNAFSMHHQITHHGNKLQTFVYNKTLTCERLTKLAAALADFDLAAETVLAALTQTENAQRMLTVKELALDKGLPVFTVGIDNAGIATVHI